MSLHSWFNKYCEKTSLPCMQYLVIKKRSLVEKVFWYLTLVIMTTLTFLSLNIVLNIWIHSPTVMFIENTQSEIQDIPFPSITICSTNQLRRWVFEKYVKTNTSNWDIIQNYRSIICTLDNLKNEKSFKPLDYMELEPLNNFIKDSAVSCSDLFNIGNYWQGDRIDDICTYIQPKLYLIGLCYTINSLPMNQMVHDEYYQRYRDLFDTNNTYITENSKWNVDDGYSLYLNNNVLLDVVPARTSGVSYYHRFKMTLHHYQENDFLKCPFFNIVEGFIVLVSNPADHYSISTAAFIVPETYSKIHIIPAVKKISQDLKWRSPEVRKCYLHNERKLSIFKSYTQKNCHQECVINKTISMCSCVSFIVAHLVDPGVKICGLSKNECMYKAIASNYLPHVQNICNCLPTCNSISYEIIKTSHYDNWTYTQMTKMEKNNSKGAIVEFIFKDPYFLAYKAASILNIDSLISTIGGILSLFLGMNLINIFEIVYVMIQVVYSYVSHMFDK